VPSKDTARTACVIAVFFGGFMFARDPEAGPLTTAYRLFLVIGGGIGLLLLGFLYRQDQNAPSQQSPAVSTERDEPEVTQAARPQWMGNREGSRRRLLIVFGVLVVVAAGLITFALVVRGQ
jgi:hypothetical protein